MASLFTDFLAELGVCHTEQYSDSRFAQMPFQSMFGLSKLLGEYGVPTAGITVDEASRTDVFAQLPVPFLADTPQGFMIVTGVDGDNVTYISQHQRFTASVDEVVADWNGIALLAGEHSGASEPEYMRHHIAGIMTGVKRWVLALLAVALVMEGMWLSGLYATWAAWLLLVADGAGMAFSWMLVQKSLGTRNKVADTICSVIEDEGCDEIARSEASSFMGIFKWSEVGLAYFSVSLLSMLLFPSTLPALAAINMLCLPYTVWSITYQRFVAKTWCTLCVCVQATLWVLFAAYLLGGFTAHIFPLGIDFWILGAVYVAVLLAINRLDDFLLTILPQNKL